MRVHRIVLGQPSCGFTQENTWPAGHCWSNDPEDDFARGFLDKEGGDVLCPGCWERPRCSAHGASDCGPCQLAALKAALTPEERERAEHPDAAELLFRRLCGRRDANLRTAAIHPDPRAREASTARAAAYNVAYLDAVELLRGPPPEG